MKLLSAVAASRLLIMNEYASVNIQDLSTQATPLLQKIKKRSLFSHEMANIWELIWQLLAASCELIVKHGTLPDFELDWDGENFQCSIPLCGFDIIDNDHGTLPLAVLYSGLLHASKLNHKVGLSSKHPLVSAWGSLHEGKLLLRKICHSWSDR